MNEGKCQPIQFLLWLIQSASRTRLIIHVNFKVQGVEEVSESIVCTDPSINLRIVGGPFTTMTTWRSLICTYHTPDVSSDQVVVHRDSHQTFPGITQCLEPINAQGNPDSNNTQ
jgi:hypothetical protein